MKTKFILLTALIVIFTAFANAQSALVGKWKIVSITDAKTGNVPLDKAENTITFEKNRFYGSVCNNFGGNYTIAKNKLKTSRVLSTMKACNDVKTESLIISVFDKTTNFSLKNNVLTLSNPKSQITLKLEKVTKVKLSLIGSWQLHSLNLNGKNIEPTNEKEFLLNIKQDRIGGSGDCNSYGGNVAMTENIVKFSGMVSTKMFCEGSIEGQYFTALDKVTSFEFKNNQLILTDKKRTVLIFDQVSK